MPGGSAVHGLEDERTCVTPHLCRLRESFGLKDDPQDMYGVTEEEASNLLAAGRTTELFEKVRWQYELSLHLR